MTERFSLKIFWSILGVKNGLYTGMAVKYIIDKKSGKKYYTGEGRLYKKKDYPQNLAENLLERYDFCYGVPAYREPDKMEKKGFFGKTRRIYTSVAPKSLEAEYLDLFGLWKIEGLDIYTDKAVDYIRDKTTGKEYRRGKRILFKNEDTTPFPLAEHTDRYEYIYEDNNCFSATKKDYLREINANLTINTLFRRK